MIISFINMIGLCVIETTKLTGARILSFGNVVNKILSCCNGGVEGQPIQIVITISDNPRRGMALR